MKRVLVSLAAVLAATLVASLAPPPWHSPSAPGVAPLGTESNVTRAYRRWVTAYERAGGADEIRIPLGWSKALSAAHTEASGFATLDFRDGLLTVETHGLPEEAGDVWLVDNQPVPGDSVRPELHDKRLFVGRLRAGTGEGRLRVRLGARAFRDFDVDLVVVARSGRDPATDGLLFGSPTLFQRLHRRGVRAAQGLSPTPDASSRTAFVPFWQRLFETAALPVARADHDEEPLVARGRELFFEGTFQGNGRTCSTCHPAGNNLTIDPPFIATRPANDPLFVAEFIPALAVGFENPTLMRQNGLILENLDGFDRPGVMRSVPHTFALPTSLEAAGFDGTTSPPLQRTGWSGDGAPGSGSLRDFATGAVTQHFTRTLGRVPGVDFRLPNDDELDAMEAFQLSLGRQAELDLAALTFADTSVELGRRIFNNETNPDIAQGKCFRCHTDAGATTGVPGNGNFDTGTRKIPGLPGPADAGFGAQPHPDGGFGNGSFNTPPLVEAADSPPFFHNNAAATIEDAVAFYTTNAFRQAPSGGFLGPIELDPSEIAAVAAFLRVINALENVRQSLEQDDRALDANNVHRARPHITQSIEETRDAADVLRARGLHAVAVQRLDEAAVLLGQAFEEHNKHRRAAFINEAKAKKAAARSSIVS